MFYLTGTFADIDFWYSNVNDIPEWDSEVDEDAMIEELERIEKESGKQVNLNRHSYKRLLQSNRKHLLFTGNPCRYATFDYIWE